LQPLQQSKALGDASSVASGPKLYTFMVKLAKAESATELLTAINRYKVLGDAGTSSTAAPAPGAADPTSQAHPNPTLSSSAVSKS
jgi:hypothetical protein